MVMVMAMVVVVEEGVVVVAEAGEAGEVAEVVVEAVVVRVLRQQTPNRHK